MLKAMRQNTKIILWIILIAFVGTIIFAWGMNVTGKKASSAVVGVINGQKISLQQFRYAFQNMYTQAKEQMDQDLDVEAFRRLRDETWNQIVNQILIAEEIEKRNITVTDEELLIFIRSNPPPYMRNNEFLQTDGQFDPQKYAAVLADPRYDWRALENQYRAMLPMQKLQNMIMATVRVTDAEVLEDYKASNEKVQVAYIAFLPGDFQVDAETISDEDLAAYFDEHQQDFEQPRRADLDYVFMDKTPSQADEDSTRVELSAIRERALEGEDFAELAAAFSHGPSAEDGGDLGFFGRGTMDSTFEAAAFAIQEGEISDPIRTPFGWHIIKLEEKRGAGQKEEVRARHILLKVSPSQETLQALAERVDSLLEQAEQAGLSAAADEAGLETAQTGFFQEGSAFVPGLGRASDAASLAFTNKVGDIEGPFENETGVYLISLREREEAGIPPFETIKERVELAFIRAQQRELARQRGTELEQTLGQDMTLEAAAGEAGLTVMQTELFARADYVPQIGRTNSFIGTAFGLKEGQISGLVETDRGYYILRLMAHQEADLELFTAQKDPLQLDLLRKKQNQSYNAWFEEVRGRAEIEDFRDRFFRG